MDQEVQEIGLLKDLSYKELMLSSLKALKEFIEAILLEWVFYHAVLLKDKMLNLWVYQEKKDSQLNLTKEIYQLTN